VISIDELDPASLPADAEHCCWQSALVLLSGSLVLPTFVVNGAAPGRTLFAVAGVHGDEYEGMAAIRRVAERLEPATMQGRFIGIPVANPMAYEARARIAPLHLDGLNLARVFPGDPFGSPSRMLADRLLRLVLRTVGPDDLFLDFHSGSADVTFAMLIGFRDIPGEQTRRTEEAARHFGIDRVWRIPDSHGPFNAETARRGIVTLETETTGRAGCDPADVAVYEGGLWNLLDYLGICQQKEPTQRCDAAARPSVDVLSPATGFFESARRLHDDVRAGESLGTIVDLFGEAIADVTASIDGTLWALRTMPPARAGELIGTIAIR